MFFRTVRWRLTLWSTLALAVILTASAVFWHHHLVRDLLQQTDEKLLFLAREAGGALTDGLRDPERCAELGDCVRRHDWKDAVVRIFGPDGELLCTVGTVAAAAIPLGSDVLQRAGEGTPWFETVAVPQESPLRVVTYPLTRAGRVSGVIQVAESLSCMEESLRRLRLFFFIFGPVTLGLLCLGGWFLAGRALAPISRIARAARAIDADHLFMRLPVEHPGDEIAQLAESINAMLARLEVSFRKVKQFSGDASHELRTPLAILRGETEVTLRWAREAEDYRRTLESNLEEIDRMGRIIDDLLTLTRSDAGELPLEIKEISLSDLLQDLYLAGNTLGEVKQIRVYLHLEVEKEIHIRGDELRLRQMLLNLISNAIKYTPPQGRVDISLTVDREEAVVRVSDTGIGIPAEHLPRLFDRFYRIDKARNRADGGTGLGLAITKSIVEAHAGHITVDSVPEQGSTFTVYLPLQGPPPKQESATPGPPR